MNEGKRFDLAYETMPWHKVDTVIFDIGNVLINFAPDNFLKVLFPGDGDKQKHMMEHVYNGGFWPCFDRGTMTYDQAADELARRYGYPREEYLTALRGWIGLKTKREEGWRAARRCRRAGKQLILLSNYPQEGYEILRERFADDFTIFDDGVISCYVHACKPEKEIYDIVLERCDCEASRALFIDDTLANIEGAQRSGLNGFHYAKAGMMDTFFI